MKIPEKFIKKILRHAEKEAPYEACGCLTGRDGLVKRIYPMINADHGKERYSLDPIEHLKVLETASAEGLELIAVYHSHPKSPAYPSEEDIRQAYDHMLIYVIVSLADSRNKIKAFWINNGGVIEEALYII